MINSSADLAGVILDEVEVAVVPGEAFGTNGYLRLSYALSDADLVEAWTASRVSSRRLSSSCDQRRRFVDHHLHPALDAAPDEAWFGMQADAESGFHPVAHASRYRNYVISRRLPTVGDRQRVFVGQ